MSITIELEQGTQEWLDFRRTRIGASDCPIIMGVGFITPYMLWKQKLGIDQPAQENEFMTRGKKLEPVSRDFISKELSVDFKPKVLQHLEHPYLIASYDGLSSDLSCAIEIKCPGQKDHAIASEGRCPDKYYPQLQMQMAIANLKNIFYVSYNPENEKPYHYFSVSRDDGYISKMLKKCHEFYDCLICIEPPSLADKDFTIREDEEWERNAKDYCESKERYETARAKILDQCNGRSTKGSGIRVSNIFKRGNVDYSKIELLWGVDLEKYRKPGTTYMRISLEEK